MENRIFIAVVLLFLAISASAQKKIEVSELPKPAQDFLKKHFSDTTVVSWIFWIK